MKLIYGIVPPTTYVYHHCSEKQILMLDLCLLNLTFHCQYYTIYCIIFCLDILPFYHFACTGSRYNKDNKLQI